ncbi:hypothetical protein H9P43_003107 [Blastocladiella emersonii ATCC 22665]|nr:hypothetical protein H9P43_003107 [Blastocladiella emersonii ATCC 22665]
MKSSRSRPLLLALLAALALAALVHLPTPVSAQRGGSPPTDPLAQAAICGRYPPRHRDLCVASSQAHLAHDGGRAGDAERTLPPSARDKILAYLGKAKTVADGNKRVSKVAQRLARAVNEARREDGEGKQSDHLTATALAVHRLLGAARFSPVLLFGDAVGANAAEVLEDLARGDTRRAGRLDTDAFAAHAIVRTVAGVFSCYDAEETAREQSKDKTEVDTKTTACDIETALRMHQLVDVFAAWLDKVRPSSPAAAQLEVAEVPTLTEFLSSLPDHGDQRTTARAMVLDLVVSALSSSLAPSSDSASRNDGAEAKQKKAVAAAALFDVYFLPAYFISSRRPTPPSPREAREAAWRAHARIETLGNAVRTTRRESKFWFSMCKSGIDWILAPIAQMMLKGSLEVPLEDAPWERDEL